MIYLDNAATSFPNPKPSIKPSTVSHGRAWPIPAGPATRWRWPPNIVLDEGRHTLNQLFHGKEPDRFVFTLNCTDALNMAFKGVLAEGDHVITTNLEHNSVSRPFRPWSWPDAFA